nr:hypothetical protein 7 [bacterium]
MEHIDFIIEGAAELLIGKIKDELREGDFEDALMLLDYLGCNHTSNKYFDSKKNRDEITSILYSLWELARYDPIAIKNYEEVRDRFLISFDLSGGRSLTILDMADEVKLNRLTGKIDFFGQNEE